MSQQQQQLRRPQGEGEGEGEGEGGVQNQNQNRNRNQKQKQDHGQGRPVKYGDVFDVSGELAEQPVAPRDAALMQSVENLVLGQTQRGGPAAVMQSAAALNVRAGVVGPDGYSESLADQGVSVTETDLPGHRVVTESVAGQTVGKYETPTPVALTMPGGALDGGAVAIGEALEAAAYSARKKPAEQSEAAATNLTIPGGIAAAAQAAAAQAAADANARLMSAEDKTKLGDILRDATVKLPADEAATREDTERLAGGEVASVAGAARLSRDTLQ